MKQTVQIGRHHVGEGHPCFVIAEIGSNHNGSLETAKELIAAAAEAKVNAVKFQSIRFDEIYAPHLETAELASLIKSIELPEEWYAELSRWAKEKGVYFFSAPTYAKAIDLLEQVDVPVYKVASPQAAAHPDLLRQIVRRKKPTIISTGYSTYTEIAEAVKICAEESNDQIILLHCVSEYPTRPERANLRAMETLKKMFRLPVGFSDHTLGIHMTVAAAVLGASVIEKHFTLDRKGKGPDHFFALEPSELKEMVRSIREVEQGLGDGTRLEISKKARESLNSVRTRVLSRVAIPAGAPLKDDDLIYRRAPSGILLEELSYVRRALAAENIPAMTPLTWDKLKFTKP